MYCVVSSLDGSSLMFAVACQRPTNNDVDRVAVRRINDEPAVRRLAAARRRRVDFNVRRCRISGADRSLENDAKVGRRRQINDTRRDGSGVLSCAVNKCRVTSALRFRQLNNAIIYY